MWIVTCWRLIILTASAVIRKLTIILLIIISRRSTQTSSATHAWTTKRILLLARSAHWSSHRCLTLTRRHTRRKCSHLHLTHSWTSSLRKPWIRSCSRTWHASRTTTRSLTIIEIPLRPYWSKLVLIHLICYFIY